MLFNLMPSLAKPMVLNKAGVSDFSGQAERSRESWLEEQRHRRAS